MPESDSELCRDHGEAFVARPESSLGQSSRGRKLHIERIAVSPSLRLSWLRPTSPKIHRTQEELHGGFDQLRLYIDTNYRPPKTT